MPRRLKTALIVVSATDTPQQYRWEKSPDAETPDQLCRSGAVENPAVIAKFERGARERAPQPESQNTNPATAQVAE
jgi:hypothetical protein